MRTGGEIAVAQMIDSFERNRSPRFTWLFVQGRFVLYALLLAIAVAIVILDRLAAK